MRTPLPAIVLLLCLTVTSHAADAPLLKFAGKDGPGKGKKVVLVGMANEYEPETAMPMLAKVLAERHGFECTVVFSMNADGTIAPGKGDNLPGLEALDDADLLVILSRFANPPDEQMKHVAKYLEAGKPVVGLRTSTHAFAFGNKGGFKQFSHDSKDKETEGGFGRMVLGETWIRHHGPNGATSTRGLFAPGAADSPILKGIADKEVWGPTGVYGLRLPLPDRCKLLLMGEVVKGGKADGPRDPGKLNDTPQPIAWTQTYQVPGGKPGRAFTTTMGSGPDLEQEACRRLVVNGCYWALGLEDKIPAKSDVSLVGETVRFKKGMKPADFAK